MANSQQGKKSKKAPNVRGVNVNLTISYVEKIKPEDKRIVIRDKLINELMLRVYPSGEKSYYLDVKIPGGKRTSKKIGDAAVLTPQIARERAKEMLLQIQAGETFKPKLTLKALIEKYYTAYCTENYKTGQVTIDTLKKHFSWLFDRPLESITFIEIQEWRTERIRTVTAATANRNIDGLKGALSYAFKNKLIGTNPLRGFSKLPEKDSEQKVRYLTDAEYTALMAALDERENELRGKLPDDTVITYRVVYGVDEQNRIDIVQGPVLPFFYLRQYLIRNVRYEAFRRLKSIDIPQGIRYLTGRHSLGVHGNDLLIYLGNILLPLFDDLGFICGFTVLGNFYPHRTIV